MVRIRQDEDKLEHSQHFPEMEQPSRVVAINRKDGVYWASYYPPYIYPPGYVLGDFSGNMLFALLSLRKKGYAEAVTRAVPPQPALLLPQTPGEPGH